MEEDLETAKTLAIRAGAILLEHYSRLGVRWKERGNPVTEADRTASAFLVRELKHTREADRSAIGKYRTRLAVPCNCVFEATIMDSQCIGFSSTVIVHIDRPSPRSLTS